tara:strand:- start:112 stop:585 length:474 start_codon:yes stop_codon:yes gene_type:complete
MSWRDILKIDMDEARRLGDKYAPEDMEEDRQNKNTKRMNENKKILRAVIQRMKDTKNTTPDKERGFESTLSMILREMPNPPRLRGKNLDQMISMVEDYLDGKQSTNLIDRAKEMNRKYPRMGSGREDTKKAAGPVSSKTSGVHRVSYSKRDKDGKTE